MWDKLRKRITAPSSVSNLLICWRPIVGFSKSAPRSRQTTVGLSALAAALHSFYNGIENIFKRTAEELDGGAPHAEFWHRELLDSMSQPGKNRPAVISASMVERLDAYLDSRHFFRHSYVFDLRWDRMKTLVLGWEETLRLLEGELTDSSPVGARPTSQARRAKYVRLKTAGGILVNHNTVSGF